jgi:hypothetical protein
LLCTGDGFAGKVINALVVAVTSMGLNPVPINLMGPDGFIESLPQVDIG